MMLRTKPTLICCLFFIIGVNAQNGNSYRQFLHRITPSRRIPVKSGRQSYGNENSAIAANCQTEEGIEGRCSPVSACFYQYGNVESIHKNRCQIARGQGGVCCPLRGLYRDADEVSFHFDPPEWPVLRLPIRKRHVIRAVERTDDLISAFFSMENNFIGLGYVQRPNSMAAIHQDVFGPPNENLQALNVHGFRALQVTRMIGRRYGLSAQEMRDGLAQFDLYDTPYEQYCPRVPRCNARARYRTIDGSCNNLQNPLWGKANTQYSRVMPPSYSDGISEFRTSVTGDPLPLARVISNELFITSNKPDRDINVMFMQWGQFIDHDMTLGASTRATNGQGLLCCNLTHLGMPVFHPACRPIIIPANDPFYLRHNRRCNNFVRNAVGPKNNCNLGYREQTNVITSFLDASNIYGNLENRTNLIRTFRDGLLRTSRINRNEFLPYDTMNNSIACAIPRNMKLPGDSQRRCIFAGDVRVNQQPGIIALQLFFHREHNRLARVLKKLNPHWSDETLFQEARRIVGAEVQHITYNEWLPLALGRSVMKATGLLLQPQGHCRGYDPRINPSILNEFASAAFRWHTLVQDVYRLINRENKKLNEAHRMRRIFNNPSIMYRAGAVDDATFGLVSQKAQAFDNIFVEELKNFLFPASPTARFGMDLISINIQRGRDHGMPSYNAIRRACGLRPIRHFRQLNGIFQPGMAQRFALVYEDVNDIDFFVGGVNEIPLRDAIVGPTFACIVAEQFRRLKHGDRYWYENGQMEHSFSAAQLQELRKVSLAGIICANGDRYKKVQPLAMLIRSRLNGDTDCKKIPQMNLRHWKE